MRTKEQLIILYFFLALSYELKHTEYLSHQHATQTQPVGSAAMDHINPYPANVENMVSP